MRKSLWSGAVCALLVLAALPSVASAAPFTPRFTDVNTVESGCYPKGPLALPLPGQGANVGPRSYRIEAVIAQTDQAPCAALDVNVPVQYVTLLQWEKTPGAEAYKIFRGQNLIATLPADNTTCPTANSGERCQYVDTGVAAGTPETPKELPPAYTQAGGHPDLNIGQRFDYGGADNNSSADDPAPDGSATSASLRTNVLHFPPGLLANPTATTATCTLTQLIGAPATDSGGAGTTDAGEDSCPRESQVGTVVASIQSAPVNAQNPPTPTIGDIYVGVPTGDETARLFVALRPPCSEGYPAPLNPGGAACTARLGSATREVEKSFLSAKATLDPTRNYAIDNETTSVASGTDEELAAVTHVRSSTTGAKLADVPIQVRALTQNLWGFADQGTEASGDNKPFVYMPTSCEPKTMTASASSYDDQTPKSHAAPNPLQATNCDGVPFSPTFQGVVDATGQTAQNAHPSFTAIITQNENEAATKTAVVTLPEGLGTNIAALGRVCTLAQQATQAGCPASSQVGTASATTPVLPGTLSGPVYIAETGVGLPKLIVVLDGAARIQFSGAISFNSDNTRLVNTFDNLPEVTLSSFSLSIAGGSDGLLQNTRDLCDGGLGNVDAVFTGYNNKTVTRSPAVQVKGTEYCVPPNPYACKPAKPKQSIAVRGIKKGRPTLKSVIRRGNRCKKSNLRTTRMTLAKGLRFAKGAKKRIIVRANGKTVKTFSAKGKTLVIKTKANTRNITIKTKARAIRVSKAVRKKGTNQKLKFVTRVTVQSGKTYVIRKSVKPKS